ncbi:MAG: PAS domain-containing protein [Elusimicrobia bacterium]|nr:PAS domain-containing protein [Elusimicrobiota bacterium]
MTKIPSSNPDALFPIVGIGASAGGLEAVSQLLSHLPADTGMAFVVVQHLDPTRESLLPMILQKATEMPVAQAKNGVRILPNRVYVIPPNTHMIIVGGKLTLIPRPEGIHAMSVNCFLSSLADDRGNKAIAVILSGTASDGATGVKAIKSEGGIVFAQDEESAGHFGMPQSAAATGVVDFVLPPEKIAKELASIALHPVLSPDVSSLFDDDKALGQIFLQLRRATGVDFSLYKPSTIKRRLMRRLMLHKFEKLRQYVDLLERVPDEIRALHDDLLIHVTHFFREPKSIAVLRAKAFPRILKGLAPDAPIRVWVPGCSSGEEAYSLAIELFDFLSERDSINAVQIFATDISDIALERARAGVYSEEIQNHVPARLLRRFFTKVDRGYEIVKRVRDACVFAKHDLTKDPPFANVDLISCCNVLIYLGPQIQKQVLPMFHYALRPSGALILGNAETIGEFGELFGAADKKCRLYYKKPSAARIHYPTRVEHVTSSEEAALKGKGPVAAVWPETDVQKVAERILLERFAPAGVIISKDLSILHFRGHVNRYIEPATGKASLSLLKMMPAHSASTISSLINKAKKSDSPVKISGIDLGDDDGRAKKVSIEVVPFRLPISGERYFIVLFEDETPGSARGEDSGHARAAGSAKAARPEGAAFKRLKSELASTRNYLQTIVEEHEAANEELKSANEEIISSNEELQSTNEELEIAKEELQTRNGDLDQLSNDLLNLISSVHLPIIMVSSDLRIRRFSAMAEKIMNLLPGDVGRPIGDIKPKIPLPNIEEIIHDVIETVTPKELEVRDQEGHSYAVRVRPYKTTENKIEGAVIVFMDNDPILRSISEINATSAFEAVLEMGQESLAILDAHMRVKAGSRSMYQAFGLTQSSLGRSLFEIEGGHWNVPALRAHLERLAAQGVPFSKVPIRVVDRELSFSARRIESESGGPPLILLSINAPSK